MSINNLKKIYELTAVINDLAKEVYISWQTWQETRNGIIEEEYIIKNNAFKQAIKELNEYISID